MQRANVCPLPFVITRVHATWGACKCGITLCSCPLHLWVEMGASSIKLENNSKRRTKDTLLYFPSSSCLRNLHVTPRQKKGKRKQSRCLSSVYILSVSIWRSALWAESKEDGPTQSISLRGQQCVRELACTSLDKAQNILICICLKTTLA